MAHPSNGSGFPEGANYKAEDQMWYLDTGATNHLSGNKELFTTLDTNVEGTVRFGDDSCVKVEGRGSILLECKTGDQNLLTNILNIPFLKSNILVWGKPMREDFSDKTTFIAEAPLDQVYGDLCGPFTPITATGNMYYFLIVDDNNMFMWGESSTPENSNKSVKRKESQDC
ncbi:hypothetical protein E3N88_36030 [Mikania micrantha]|uniref:Retrovirus-related Pol polyprotein from transposon TNT 1-94-like beta-barrel domain-containing protein n=1 Tax=Mikania micrantha TaxID=192012 RepID=A0A5N6M2K1_9ASTR|nr:hypothetical protein E3N88_36030 [Mikania micrantha]